MNLHRSLFVSLLSRYALLIVNMGVSVVVARLLTPREMGAFSLSMVLLSFAGIFRDFGASTYLTQTQTLNPQKVRATMGLQLLIGATLAALVAGASVPLATFYGEPAIRELMLWVALSYLISPFGTVTQALLMRELKFNELARIQMGAGLAGAVVTVALAMLGQGARCLAIGQLASVVAAVIFTLPYRPVATPWLPSLRGSREILGFGGALTGIAIVNMAIKGAPEMLLGKLQGLHSVGLFARGQGMVIMFGRQLTDAVSSVALPNFSRLAREGGELGASFLHGTAYVTAVAWSACLGMVVLAEPLIGVLYGPQWHAAVPLVRWVAASYGAGLSVMLVSSAIAALGGVKDLGLATLASGVLTITAVAIGSAISLEAVGVGLFVTGLTHAAIFFALARRRLAFTPQALLSRLRASAGVAACAATLPLLVMLGPQPTVGAGIYQLLGGCVAGVIGFVGGVIVFNHPFGQELAMLRAKLRQRWPGSGGGSASP